MEAFVEKRRCPRQRISRSLNYKVSGDEFINLAHLVDVGCGGLRFQTSGEFTPGTTLQMEFELPETLDKVMSTGSVVWTGASDDQWSSVNSVGVCFTAISEINVDKISEYVSKRKRREDRMARAATPDDDDGRKTLLVVDPDGDTLESLKIILESKYKVLTASTCSEAVEKTLRNAPDLILIDILMPDEDGMSAIKMLKSKSGVNAIPILVTGVYFEKETLMEAMKAGAALYIPKPFTAEELDDKVDEVFAGM